MKRIVCIFVTICLLAAVSDAAESGAEDVCRVLICEWQTAQDGTVTVRIGLSPVPGGVCGAMPEVSVSSGWRLTDVRKEDTSDAAGMTVTVLPLKTGALVLLDSPVPVPSEAVVLILTIVPDQTDGAEALTVTVGPAQTGQGSTLIYYMKETGVIRTLPLAGCEGTIRFDRGEAEKTTAGTEPATEPAAKLPEESAAELPAGLPTVPPETDAETEPGREVPDPPAALDPGEDEGLPGGWVLIGCREAVTGTGADRELHVRFLFRAADGAGQGMPDVRLSECPGGRAPIRLRAERGADGLAEITFYGLPAEGTVTFCGHTESKKTEFVFHAVYKNGDFQGWSSFQTPHSGRDRG